MPCHSFKRTGKPINHNADPCQVPFSPCNCRSNKLKPVESLMGPKLLDLLLPAFLDVSLSLLFSNLVIPHFHNSFTAYLIIKTIRVWILESLVSQLPPVCKSGNPALFFGYTVSLLISYKTQSTCDMLSYDKSWRAWYIQTVSQLPACQ